MNDVPLSLQNWTSPLDKCYAAFITGANTISAMGFEDPIRVYFEHEAEMKYPNASTCVPSVTLPACMTSYEVRNGEGLCGSRKGWLSLLGPSVINKPLGIK